MERHKLGYLEGEPRFEYNARELQAPLDKFDTDCQKLGFTPIAFIGVRYGKDREADALVLIPMASMSDAEATSLTEKLLPVAAEALRESDEDQKKKFV